MKKLFTMMSMAAMTAMTMAQGVTTHSVYDVNQSGEINVADAASVAQATLQSLRPESTQQYVTAEDLSKLLQSIQSDLTLIKEKLGIANDEGEGDDNPATGSNNGHEYVDLGTVIDGKPVYWATTNIGAELPADRGLYFAWGETEGYTSDTNDGREFDWANYSAALCGGGDNMMRKYCTNSGYGTVDGKTVLDLTDDAAHVNWQGTWRMPTKEEQDALLYQCTWTWSSMTNSAGETVDGYKVANKADASKYIFLPATGFRNYGDLNDPTSGYYWSSSLDWSANCNAVQILFCITFSTNDYAARCYGRAVRAVCQ